MSVVIITNVLCNLDLCLQVCSAATDRAVMRRTGEPIERNVTAEIKKSRPTCKEHTWGQLEHAEVMTGMQGRTELVLEWF